MNTGDLALSAIAAVPVYDLVQRKSCLIPGKTKRDPGAAVCDTEQDGSHSAMVPTALLDSEEQLSAWLCLWAGD